MLRNLNRRSTSGAVILGTPYVGKLAAEIPTGFTLPSLLANDVDAADPAGTRYREERIGPLVNATGQVFTDKLTIGEDGALSLVGVPDGTYTAPMRVYKYSPTAGLFSTADTTLQLVVGATPAAQVTGVTVSPATVSVAGGATQQFTKTVTGTGAFDAAVNWTTTAGQVNSSGLFTAPAATNVVQTITVTATSAADSTKKGTATVTVAAQVVTLPPVTGVTITPATVTMGAGDVQQFTATATGNSPQQSFTWTRTPPVGTLTTSGEFTAPEVDAPTPVTIVATSLQDPDYAGTAEVMITPEDSGLGFVRSKTRTIKIKSAPLTFEGSAFWNLKDPRKPMGSIDPDATIDVSFDWAEVLADISDTIKQVDFNLVGLVSQGGFERNGIATVFVTQPSVEQVAITCHITTNSTPSRTEERTVYLIREDQ